jgi:cation diffusion facilitator family transporter
MRRLTMTNLTRYAWLSIAAAVVTITMKSAAYLLTGSVGLLSDALESVVNLVAALIALGMLALAARPADENHAYGHTKAEYFSSGAEGALIVAAAAAICGTAVERLLHPQGIEKVGLGLIISVLASGVNFWVARVLLRAAKQFRSITLEADSRHLMTDVWTSGGVLIAVGAVAVTGWQKLDPIIALLVAANIIWSGIQLMKRSAHGLLDVAIGEEDRAAVDAVLERYRTRGIEFHALRTRQSGSRPFIAFHVLVTPEWTVKRGHDLLEEIEADIRAAIPRAHVFTHLEPLGDPRSDDDVLLSRGE